MSFITETTDLGSPDRKFNKVYAKELINGIVATTQTAGDNSNKVATTEYVDTALAGKADVSALQGKANTDLGNIDNNIDYVVDSYTDNNGNWYRVYKSGWVEQGGKGTGLTGNVAHKLTVSLLKEMADANYHIIVDRQGMSLGEGTLTQIYTDDITSTTFSVCEELNGAAAHKLQNFIWSTCGQGATE